MGGIGGDGAALLCLARVGWRSACSPAWSRLAESFFETERQDAPLRLILSAIVSP